MHVTIRQALAQCGLVPIDAQVLLVHVVERDRAWLVAHRDDALTRAQAEAFFALARQRRDGQPVAYLTGRREFRGLTFAVSPAVLIPRPETETLVELALEWLPPSGAPRVLDLGAGSGAVALALAHARPDARIVAVDTSAAALAVASANARSLGLSNVGFIASDWYANVGAAAFDLIVSNPPYIALADPHLTEGDLRFEPKAALVSGPDGLDALRAIIEGAPAHLAAGGALLVEHGYDQAEAVGALLRDAGFVDVVTRRDLAGIVRVAGGRVSRQA